MERDRLLLFLNKLILHRDNVAAVVQNNGVRILIDLLPLAHLHTNRAVVNSQTQAIEANPESTKQSQVGSQLFTADVILLNNYPKLIISFFVF